MITNLLKTLLRIAFGCLFGGTVVTLFVGATTYILTGTNILPGDYGLRWFVLIVVATISGVVRFFAFGSWGGTRI